MTRASNSLGSCGGLKGKKKCAPLIYLVQEKLWEGHTFRSRTCVRGFISVVRRGLPVKPPPVSVYGTGVQAEQKRQEAERRAFLRDLFENSVLSNKSLPV